MKKRRLFGLLLLCMTAFTVAANTHSLALPHQDSQHYYSEGISRANGGVIEYTGTIGQYKVEFTFMNLHMGRGEELYYRYTNVRVNKGEQIELIYKRQNGKYDVYYEYINGKHTGTFNIIRTSKKITGTFRNSKGQTFKVNAFATGGNYVEEY